LKNALLAFTVTLAAAAAPWPQSPRPSPVNAVAEQYVKLVLALGQHDADYVDAFYGPPEWKAEAARQKMPLPQIRAGAERLLNDLPPLTDADRKDELVVLRRDYLKRQLEALRARVRMLEGEKLTFDEESQALYDAVAPSHSDAYFEATLKEIAAALPGEGPLVDRYEAFRRKFVVPADQLSRVFDARSKSAADGRCPTCSSPRTRPSRSST
jgi:hypothetical protein